MTKVRRSREGETLAGKYRLGALLGAGGMGEVYRAENVALGRAVAIKVLREEHAESAEVVARFLREARAANIVRHPNVVDVLDIGQADDGTPFIVQELLVGEDLASYARARAGRLAIDEALSILIPAIDAVAFAHARGVIHRDLKPENIFLARDASGNIVPKLLDFGISRIVSADEQRMTATGMSVGTPAYMSPEQIRADKVVDVRTDVWSLGVILHEILAGSLPFQSGSHTGLFVKIVTELPIPLVDAVPNAPPELAAIVDRCLRARAVERFASAADLAAALRTVAGMPPRAPSIPDRQASDPSLGAGDRSNAPALQAGPVLYGRPAHSARPADATHPQIELGGPVVPDLALPAPRPKPAANRPLAASAAPAPTPPSAVAATPMRPASPASDDLVDAIIPLAGGGGLDLAAQPSMQPMVAPRIARANRAIRNEVPKEPPAPERSILGLGVMWLLVLALTAVLTTIFAVVAPAGWPVITWATTLDGAPPWLSFGVVGLGLILGVGAFVAGARSSPVSWGLVLAAPGLVIDALLLAGFAIRGLPSLTGSGGLDGLARIVFPWPTMLILLGLCVLCLRGAWSSWSGGQSGRTSAAAVGLLLAALALVGAVEVFRGAESAAQTTTIAS